MTTATKLGKVLLSMDIAELLLQQVPKQPIPVKAFAGDGNPHGAVGFVKELNSRTAFAIHSGKQSRLFPVGKVEIVKSRLSHRQLEIVIEHYEAAHKDSPRTNGSVDSSELVVLRRVQSQQAPTPTLDVVLAAGKDTPPAISTGLQHLQQLMAESAKLREIQAQYKAKRTALEEQLELLRMEESIAVEDLKDTIEIIRLDLNDSDLAAHGLALSTVEPPTVLPEPVAAPGKKVVDAGKPAELWDKKEMKAYLKKHAFRTEEVKGSAVARDIVRALPSQIQFNSVEFAEVVSGYARNTQAKSIVVYVNQGMSDIGLVKRVSKGVYQKVL